MMLSDEIASINDPQPPHDGIHRDGLDRPMVFSADHKGPLDFTRGKTVPNRRGYARVTSFIDVLDSKDALDNYHSRNAIGGLVRQPHLFVQAKEALQLGDPNGDPNLDSTKVAKGALNHIVAEARQAFDEGLKAARGTAVHRWCEEFDYDPYEERSRKQFVDGYEFHLADYVQDINAYGAATSPLMRCEYIEKLCINDELQTAGTPDRIAEWIGPRTLIPGDGDYVEPGDVLITDIKTGSVEYGIGKYACQLAVYANSVLYDQGTNTRTAHGARTDVGLIIHLPAGTGQVSLIWVDLQAGWAAVTEIATRVRAWRNDGKKVAFTHGKNASIEERIYATFSASELRQLWQEFESDWTPEHTALAAERVKEFEKGVAG